MWIRQMEQEHPIDEQDDQQVRKVELLISGLLRIGVSVSLLLLVSGTILSFVRPPRYGASAADLQHLIRPGATFPRTAEWLLDGLRRMEGQAIIVLGLLVLIATPVLRVAASIFAFVHQRDRVFILITSTVLVLLVLSFVLGKAAG